MKPTLSEQQIQDAIVEFMILDGWRAFRMDPVSDVSTVNVIRRRLAACAILRAFMPVINKIIDGCVRGKGFGEPGMPDYLFLRYRDGWSGAGEEIMWHEYKRPGGKPESHQKTWHHAEVGRGALVRVVDDIDDYHDWYFNSGLARKIRQTARAAAE